MAVRPRTTVVNGKPDAGPTPGLRWTRRARRPRGRPGYTRSVASQDLHELAGRNRILRALPAGVRQDIAAQLQPIEMHHGRVLFEADEPIEHVYFPITGVCSMLALSPDGEATDVAVVGSEGFVGLPLFLGTERMPLRAVAQVPGIALEMTSQAFLGFLDPRGALERLLRRYTQMRMVEMGQTVLCNRVHPIEERTARWLLQLSERSEDAPFELTQEFFSVMLGATRPSVTLAASSLREQGLIDYSRGVIEVLDRDGLEAASCPCYRIVRDELDRLLELPSIR